MQDLEGFRRQGQDTPLVAFAEDAEVCFGGREVFELELENLAGAQTIKQHQSDDGQIAKGAKTSPELVDLVGREGDDQVLGLPQSQTAGDPGLRPTVAER